MGYAFCYLKSRGTDIHIYKANRDANNLNKIIISSEKALCNKNGTNYKDIHSLEKYCEKEQEAKNHIANMGEELCSDCSGYFHSN